MSVIINVNDKRWNAYEIDVEKIALAALDKGYKNAELSITLTNDAELQRLNKKYRGKNAPTNVLSFETEDKELLGDIFISFDTVMKESGDDFAAHAAHMIVHGVLHLQGMDHMDDRDAEVMERKEEKILRELSVGAPRSDGCRGDNFRPKKFPRINRFGRILSAPTIFLLGFIGVFGFAPYYMWPATVLSLGAAYYFVKGWRGGFLWGAGYGLASFRWALESIFANAEIAAELWWLYPPGVVGIAVGSGLVFAIPFWMTAKTESEGARRVLYFALAWTFVLWLREWLLTGFPWNPLANITMPIVQLSGLMSIMGALGLTFLLVGAIAAIAEYIKSRARLPLLFFMPLLVGPLILPRPSDDMSETFARIVQPSFDMNQKFDRLSADNNVKTLVRLSGLPSEHPIDIVVWPETAYPYAVNRMVRMPALGVPLVAGAVYINGNAHRRDMFNAMVLSNADGAIEDVYFKFHLVPFGEYRPLGLPIPTPSQLSAGPGPRMMSNFAPAICYEIVFSDMLLRRGSNPDFILNITNDAWFGTSVGPHQHLDMARRQAIETGLSIVRANHSGISAFIDSRGRVLSRLGLDKQGVLDGFIPSSYVTLYRRIGLNGVMLIILLLSAAVLIPEYFRKKGRA